MGAFTFDFPAELENQLVALERAASDGAVTKILAAGGKEVEDELKRQCQAHSQSGNMVKSIRTTKAKKNHKGYFVVSRPTGKETREPKGEGKRHTVRNMEKLAYLHYGTAKQPATGILTKTMNQARNPALEAMQKAYNEEVGVN